jgi:hypothetical protein
MSIRYRNNLTALFLVFFTLMTRIATLLYKGLPAGVEFLTLSLAKNLFFTNTYSIENTKGMILSSNLVNAQGFISQVPHKFTSIIYSNLFKIFGFDLNLLTLVPIILFSLSVLILFFAVLKKFNYKIALIFSLISIFTPILWYNSLFIGFYEFALFFFSLGIFFFLRKRNFVNIFFAGTFFILAALFREVFLISFLIFLAYLFLKTK